MFSEKKISNLKIIVTIRFILLTMNLVYQQYINMMVQCQSSIGQTKIKR